MEQDKQTVRQALIAEIESAFDGVQRANGVTLHQTRVLDFYGDEREEAEARAKDTDTRWQDVPDTALEEYSYDPLSFLDPVGFHYYIPAYMRWALRYHDKQGSRAPGGTVVGLQPDDPGSMLYESGMERLRVFTPAQASAIAHFLQYFTGPAGRRTWNDDAKVAQEALDKYWQQFL